MRCFVTGASGFLGSALIPKLLERGHSVVALLRESSKLGGLAAQRSKFEIVYGDLLDVQTASASDGWVSGLDGAGAVFHLGWPGVTAQFRDDADQIRKNLVATLALWDRASVAGCKVWIGVGSQAEYGPVSGILTEATPAFPVTAYGVAKLAAGLTTSKLSELCGMRHVWLRLLSAYGPGDSERNMVPMAIRAFLQGRRPALTAGEQIWDYIYVDDVAEALCAALDSDVDGIFNLGSGVAQPLRDIVLQIRDLIDPSLPVGFGEIPYSRNQVMHLEADISGLTSATRWQPRTSLAEGLAKTINWARKQGPNGS